jgi:hypothetical protein
VSVNVPPSTGTVQFQAPPAKQPIVDLVDTPDPQSLWRIVPGMLPDQIPNNSTSLALEASHIVVAGEARLCGVSGYSNKAGTQFIQVHDSPTLPADGAAPAIILVVAATGNFSIDLGSYGRWFYRGIVLCNSSTAATKTIGSADCWFDVQFI